ncbi:MAG: (2Fe-2S)-binding protein [Armatimonadetes bacterium]|nr:(2Fe-2S)-binding protein [Armatimonadota bacterium]
MRRLLSVSGVNLGACDAQSPGSIHAQADMCGCCGAVGLPVLALTMRNMVRDDLQSLVDEGFRFCSTPECQVVYFDNGSRRYFSKADLKVRVGIKETEHPVPVCYCLGVTEADILRAIVENGCCNTLEDVKHYTGARTGRECRLKNPSGRCCEAHVRSVIERGLAVRRAGKGHVRTGQTHE